MTSTATLPQTPTVRPATGEDLPALGAALARSYASCPGWNWWLPPETSDRLARMERFFGALLRLYVADGRECWTTDDAQGAALLDPPERWQMSARETLGMLATMLPAFRRTALRAIRGFSALDAAHPREPHVYLSALGVMPGRDGRTIVPALLAPALARCDRDRLACYAETARPASRNFLAGSGFEVVAEIELPGGGPTAWGMWREPAA